MDESTTMATNAEVIEHTAVIYQDNDGVRQRVKGSYAASLNLIA
jgi:hypothetical protein